VASAIRVRSDREVRLRKQNRSATPLLVALFATVCMAAPAVGQAVSPARQGFYISLGLGYASVDATGSQGGFTPSELKTGLGGYFALGGTINPHLRIGFESDAYTKEFQGLTVTAALYSGSLSFYPSVDNNLWFKVNLGYVLVGESGDGVSTSEGGFGAGVAIGYDILPGNGKFAIIPYAMYVAQITGGTFDADPGETWKAHMFQIGVGFGYKH
jgi:opacity protein-like surface antigen